MTYDPKLDPYKQWDPHAYCPTCKGVLGYGACLCPNGVPTLPLIATIPFEGSVWDADATIQKAERSPLPLPSRLCLEERKG